MNDTAIVFLTHLWSNAVARRFERLWRESTPAADCFLVLQDDDVQVLAAWQAYLASIGASRALFRFSAAQLPDRLGLRYFGMRQIMGNAHFPMLLFAQSHRYAFYWQVEGDVEYRGPWNEFFGTYRETDASLLAAHCHNWADWPEWFWWPSVSAPP